ncbi:hypothetical protein BTVI_121914 [Pitangus sulphuratus]|nr:hypothetical protein BTVI_121914 [Pitangus sulphuratus]
MEDFRSPSLEAEQEYGLSLPAENGLVFAHHRQILANDRERRILPSKHREPGPGAAAIGTVEEQSHWCQRISTDINLLQGGGPWGSTLDILQGSLNTGSENSRLEQQGNKAKLLCTADVRWDHSRSEPAFSCRESACKPFSQESSCMVVPQL